MPNMNDTITMLQAISRISAPVSALLDTFFPLVQTFPTEKVQIDYRDGKRKVAPFIKAGYGRGVNVIRDGFQRVEYDPPMMAPQRPLDLRTVSAPGMGETVYSAMTPEERALKIRMEDLQDLRNMTRNRMEQMIAGFLTTRSFDLRDYVDDGKNYVEELITFPGSNVVTLTGSDAWDNQAADLYGAIDHAANTILQTANTNQLVAIAAPNVVRLMLQNEKFMKLLDIRNLKIASFAPRLTSVPGMKYIGNVGETEIYSYFAQYVDEEGIAKPYIPDNYFVVGVPGEGRQLFGAITQLDGTGQWNTYEGMFVPKYWADLGGDVEMLRLGTRFMPAPANGNDFFTYIVK